MDENLTDDERLEQMKKWWGENGSSIVTGVVLGLAVLFGGKAWFAYEQRQAENASTIYAGLMNSLQGGDALAVSEKTGILISEYSATPYASLGALALAKVKIEAGELEAGRAQLQWVLDNGGSDIVRNIARIRLVRVALAEEDTERADALLSQADKNAAYEPLYAELRGDIAAARGNLVAANKAYNEALGVTQPGSPGYHMLQLKFSDTATDGATE